MIDENLCRAELSAAERAQQTARRKAIYLEIHPETGHGKAGLNKDDKLSSFAQSTADAIGKSERSIQRDAARGEGIASDVLDTIKGTALDNGAYLDRLKVVPLEDQRARDFRALAGQNVSLNATAPLPPPIAG